MRALLAVATLTVAFSVTITSARADDGAELLAKIRAATLGATSYVVQAQATNVPSVSGTFTFVPPANFKSRFTFGTTAIESYAVDGMVYEHVPDGGWQKTKADQTWLPASYVKLLDGLKAPRVTVLPDRKAHRTILGAFAAEVLLPATPFAGTPPSPQPVVCTYDKSSFLMRQCSTSSVSIIYSKYNDPANTVVLPDEAKHAVLVIHRGPPDASDPGPAPAPVNSPAPAPVSDTPAPTHSALPTLSPAPAASSSPER